MLSRRFAVASATVLLLGAVGCGGGEGETGGVTAEEAGVGPEAGAEVLVDTAATPPGGMPGVTPGGAGQVGGTGAAGTTAPGADTAGAPR